MEKLIKRWESQEDAIMDRFMHQHRRYSIRDMKNGCQAPFNTVKLQKKIERIYPRGSVTFRLYDLNDIYD